MPYNYETKICYVLHGECQLHIVHIQHELNSISSVEFIHELEFNRRYAFFRIQE